jgi:signal transduction histidine kinase
VLVVAHDALRLADLVRINDTLTWSLDYRDSFVSAVAIVRDVVRADLAPAFMLSESGTRLELLTDPEQRERLGPGFSSMPVGPYVRPPWINPGEFPVSARDHLGEEAWAVLPPEFKAWFGTSGIVVPIHADQRHLGAILLAFDRPYTLTGEVRDFLAIAGRILGSAIYRWQVAAHERELGALEERRRISEELHDDLSQQIATLGLRIESARLHAEDGDLATIRADQERLADMVEELKRTVRHEMLGLRTDGDATEGTFLTKVKEHIDHFHSQFNVPVALVCPAVDAADRVPIDVGTQLLRVLQESLANAYRHSGASGVSVRLLVTSTKARIEVQDDGEGFTPASIPASRMGVRIMRQRMDQVDGTLEISQVEPHGTIVVAEAPLRTRTRAVVHVEDLA